MKFPIFALLALFAASSALADGAPVLTVKINSFTRLGDANSTLGELCGTVTVTDTTAMAPKGNLIPVTITADPNSNDPGMYTVLADPNGNFCSLINAYTGTAQAAAWLPNGTEKDSSEVAHVDSSKRH